MLLIPAYRPLRYTSLLHDLAIEPIRLSGKYVPERSIFALSTIGIQIHWLKPRNGIDVHELTALLWELGYA